MRRFAPMLLVLACASEPVVPVVTLGPEDADTRDDLIAQVDGESEATSFLWYRDDQRVAEVNGPRLPSSLTARGEQWRVEVVVSNGKVQARATDSLTIRNAPPLVTVELAPEVPEAGDTLVVAVIPWDADDDELTTQVTWFRDGQVQTDLTTDRVPAERTRRGQVWAVEVAANDGFLKGPTVREEVTILNAAPQVVEGGLSPAEPRTDDTLTAWATLEDADGDGFTATFTWLVNGEIVQEGKGTTLAPSFFQKGDVVSVDVSATDGTSTSDATPLGSVTILNTAPGSPSPRIVPSDPVAGEVLRCEVAITPGDADGDTGLTYEGAWTVDGTLYTGATRTSFAGDTIPAGITDGDEVWTCSLRASDGQDWGKYGGTQVTVAWDGFLTSQIVAGRTLTCSSVTNGAAWTQCNHIAVGGQQFPNGLSCGLGWSSTPSPRTDHASLCALITGNRSFEADYQCATLVSRVTWSGGTWGTVTDNGYTRSLRCAW